MVITSPDYNGYSISTDNNKLAIDVIHQFLSKQSHWSRDISIETVKAAIVNSLCFGVFHGNEQVGFAIIITDYATIAYIGDVFILPPHRGKGLSYG